jgi:hypothetical protein
LLRGPVKGRIQKITSETIGHSSPMFRVVAVHEHDINMDITFMEISLIINYTIRWEEDINI